MRKYSVAICLGLTVVACQTAIESSTIKLEPTTTSTVAPTTTTTQTTSQTSVAPIPTVSTVDEDDLIRTVRRIGIYDKFTDAEVIEVMRRFCGSVRAMGPEQATQSEREFLVETFLPAISSESDRITAVLEFQSREVRFWSIAVGAYCPEEGRRFDSYMSDWFLDLFSEVANE